MKSVVCAGALALIAATPALADPVAGRGSASIFAGADFTVDGELHGGTNAPVANLGPLNPSLSGVSAELRIQSRDYSDIYDDPYAIGVEGAYGLSDNAEVFGQIRYTQADEGTVQVGGAFVPALNTTLPVFGTFGDYTSLAAEAGYRYYFGRPGELRPYVAGRIGAARVDEIRATFRIPDANITIANAPFYEESWVLSGGVDLGVSYQLNDRVTLQAETGLRYQNELEGDDSAIGGLGLASINDTGERLSVPVTVRARFAF